MEDFIAWHGCRDETPTRFGGLDTHPQGIHLGSLAQARMRAGRGPLLKLRVRASRLCQPIPRVRDQEDSWRALLGRRARKGAQILAYLNRYEGLPTERVLALSEIPAGRLA